MIELKIEQTFDVSGGSDAPAPRCTPVVGGNHCTCPAGYKTESSKNADGNVEIKCVPK
ncbi:hypothetical protein ACO1PK_04670 [Alishewanella sp. d11]|uniref:hypothetical protein n=1 Tax=Alishewanella sp. d11 TaxID=3414030 RepID=UPI003BF7FAE1